MRKPVYAIYKQQRRRSACASAQSDQRLCCCIMAAFRYPDRTRPNSGPDQIILVLKISTEPIRSWCCLHIHAKFWSAAAVDNSGPISVS